MTAELRTAREVLQHARHVQRRINEQFRAGVVLRKLSVPLQGPEPEPTTGALPPVQGPKAGPKPRPKPKGPLVRHPVRLIIDITANYFEEPSAALFGTSRMRKHARPRQVAFYIAHRFGYSWPAIGHWANKDHTTVLHGARNIGERLKRNDPWAIAAVDAVGSEAASVLGLSWQPAATHFEHAAVTSNSNARILGTEVTQE